MFNGTDTKKICLTNSGADSLLESCALKGVELVSTDYQARDFSADGGLVREVLSSLSGATSESLDILVSDRTDRRECKSTVCHGFSGSLPSGSILHLEGRVYLASANLNLLLQARELHPINLCQMLGRYMGTFSSESDDAGNPLKRAPLTSEESLLEYLNQIQRTTGLAALRDAMNYACERAASPQEVNLQLALCLPRACNGFGLKKPLMNYQVPLDAAERELYDAENIRIDLCWPDAHFGLEYLGVKAHEGKMLEDIGRWYAAQKAGFELWFVTKDQLYNPIALDAIARKVAVRTRRRVREGAWPPREEVQALIDVLRGKKKLKPRKRLRKRPLREAANSRRPKRPVG